MDHFSRPFSTVKLFTISHDRDEKKFYYLSVQLRLYVDTTHTIMESLKHTVRKWPSSNYLCSIFVMTFNELIIMIYLQYIMCLNKPCLSENMTSGNHTYIYCYGDSYGDMIFPKTVAANLETQLSNRSVLYMF